MNDEAKEKRIQQYLDGELESAEKAELKKQLKSDPELKQLLEDYTVLRHDLQDLDGSRLPADFWKSRVLPAMKEEMGIEQKSFTEKLAELFDIRINSLKPVFLGLVFVGLVLATTFFLQNNMSSSEQSTYQQAYTRIEELRQQFLAELKTLGREMENRKEHFVPEVLTAYQNGLEAIDKAIEVAERYYTMNAGKEESISTLIAAYSRKASYMKEFLSLDINRNGGGDEY